LPKLEFTSVRLTVSKNKLAFLLRAPIERISLSDTPVNGWIFSQGKEIRGGKVAGLSAAIEQPWRLGSERGCCLRVQVRDSG
jgi:hypothetical protein